MGRKPHNQKGEDAPAIRWWRTGIEDCLEIQMWNHEDHRGTFEMSFHEEHFSSIGMCRHWGQDNISVSHPKVIRGLHFQTDPPQAKLVRCLQGKIWDVCVDLRRDSSTYRQWTARILSDENRRALYIPPGCAHGFAVLSEHQNAIIHYKCDHTYRQKTSQSILWNDPALDIAWPVDSPILSSKDMFAPKLSDYLANMK